MNYDEDKRMTAHQTGSPYTVGGQITRLTEGLSKLDAMIGELEERLSPTLTATYNDGEKGDDSPEAVKDMSPLAEQLENLADRVHRRIAQVDRLRSRVNL